jgi:Cellulose biosynthesis protein BcsS
MVFCGGGNFWSGFVACAIAMLAFVPVAVAAEPEPGDPRRLVLFASMEAGPATKFGSAGFKLALGGPLDASGFRLMGKVGTGFEPRQSVAISGTRTTSDVMTPEAMAVAGYEWKLGTTYFGLYGGAEIDARLATKSLAINRPIRLGPRLQLDIWSNPTPGTLVHYSGNLGGATFHVWSRLALGWRVFDLAFLGPEAEIYREKDYAKTRIGIHLTALKLFGTEMRLSGGWQRSGKTERGAYATLGLLWKR